MMSETAMFYVYPGEMRVGEGEDRILTILGSCMAIVAWHPLLQVGGMSHYMLPGRRCRPRGELNGRYSEDALELLVRALFQRGACLHDCQIKLFGGGNMFPGSHWFSRQSRIGCKNIEAAHGLMRRHHLKPIAEHVGGNGHRKLALDVANGCVWMRYSPIRGAE